MIYLIGGVPRTGKTQLALRIMHAMQVPFVSTDSLVHMLKNVIPQAGVTDKIHFRDKAYRFYPYLEQFVKYTQYGIEHYLVEGEAFLPEQIDKLSKKYSVRACFLGFSKIDSVTLRKHVSRNNWIAELSDQALDELAEWIAKTSSEVEQDCKKFDIVYFDLAGDYKKQVDKAYEYLVAT